MYNVIIISDDDSGLHNLILLLKISTGTQKFLSGNYRQFGHASLQRFTSAALDHSYRGS
jgi:hypothetical protein